MAAGKSTLAIALAKENNAILLTEDDWLSHLYPEEIAANTWDKMIAYYKEYQLLFLHDEKIVCIFNCMLMNNDFTDEALPDDAFEWGMAKGSC